MPDDPATPLPAADPPPAPDLGPELLTAREALAQATADRDAALGAAALANTEAAARAESHAAELAALQGRHLEAHRRALLAEHRGSVIDELVSGDTPEALEASIETASAAYARIAAQVTAALPPAAPVVPPGAGSAAPALDLLSPADKIARGLQQRAG